MPGQHHGHILWTDLTVGDAPKVRDFYAAVIGWTFEEVDMGGYSDYTMVASSEAPSRPDKPPFHVAGVCHAKGGNAELPAQWLNYFGVQDIDHSCAEVDRLGGKRLTAVKSMGKSRYCVIEDPAGAVCAIFENVTDES